MGYYIDIMKEPGTAPERETVFRAFRDTGFRDRLELEKGGGGSKYYASLKPGEEWVHLKLGVIANFYGKENAKHPGEWGCFRLSWGTSRDEGEEILVTLFAFAKLAGCRLYDGQAKRYIREDDLGEAFLTFDRLSEKVKAMLGTVRQGSAGE